MPVSGERSSAPSEISRSQASRSATSPPVIDAQRVPPSACEHVAVDVHGPLAERGEVDHAAQRTADQPLDLDRAAVRPAAADVALLALAGRGGQHPVLGGDPSAARPGQPARHAVLDRGGADHAGLARPRSAPSRWRCARTRARSRSAAAGRRPVRSSARRAAGRSRRRPRRQLDVHDLAQRHLQEARPERLERLDVAGAEEPVAALVRRRIRAARARPARARRCRATPAPEVTSVTPRPSVRWSIGAHERVVRAAEDHRVDLGRAQRHAVGRARCPPRARRTGSRPG